MTVTVTLVDRQTDITKLVLIFAIFFFANVHYKKWVKERDKECGEGKLTKSKVKSES